MQMDAGLDTGPLLECRHTAIGETETGSQLHDRLAQLGAELLADNLDVLQQGTLKLQPQDTAGITYARKLDKSEAVIDWSGTARDIGLKVRAFNAWPVAETRFRGSQLRIWDAQPLTGDTGLAPGTVISSGREGIKVACGAGQLLIRKVQLPGARAVSAADFINAHPHLEGIRLGAC